MKKIYLLAILLACVTMVTVRLQVVNSQEITIQSLIDSASGGDTIYLPAGIYYEQLYIKKPLTLIGAPTTIDGNNARTTIRIESVENVTIKNLILQNTIDGVNLDLSHYCTVENCIIQNAIWAIAMSDARHQTIKNNIIRNNFNGIDFYGPGNLFVGNRFENNRQNAIHLCASNNTFESNIFLNNFIGIYVACYSNYNTFYNNSFINSTWTNMQIWQSHSNMIYYNNFFKGIGKQVIFESGELPNTWDNGAVGNYWSDYKGVDLNSDGIGDVSYNMTENNIDFYPLMNDPPIFPDSTSEDAIISGPYYTWSGIEYWIIQLEKHPLRLVCS